MCILCDTTRTVYAHLSLQGAIQEELIKRGYSAEPGLFTVTHHFLKALISGFLDPVMAEYITIMIINNKTRGMYQPSSHTIYF